MSATPLSRADRYLILAAGFLGWLCAGLQMGLVPLTSRSAAGDLLFGHAPQTPDQETQAGVWFSWFLCAFLLGGAVGGWVFGRIGDRAGRVRAMGLSILGLSLLTGACGFVASPGQLVVLRFLASLGIGGMWTAGVTLVSEAWPEASRPTVAGVLGTAANVGILLVALGGHAMPITPATWRIAMYAAAAPAVLGVGVLLVVPESRTWLAARRATPLGEIFRPPLLRRTLLGILIATIPLLGTWASGKWLIPWAEKEGTDQATAQAWWAAGAVLGSAVGGVQADLFGRRTTYFIISAATLALNLFIYRCLHPADAIFLPAVFVLGLVATVFFGLLPLYLPELFPTHVRATGSGVSFNSGRIASAAGVLGAGGLMAYFGDYARVGEVTAWVYALGMVVILLAPDTTRGTDGGRGQE
jgi:MFS family permease